MTYNKKESQLPEKHSTRQSTPTGATSDEICSLFRPEYIEYVRQLADMENWFYNQMLFVPKNQEGLLGAYGEIVDAFGDIVHNISELVAYEFKDNLFFKPIENR